VMRYLTGGRPTPREEIRDQILPFHLAVYDRLDRLGTWAAESTATGEFLGWFHFPPGQDADITNIDLGYRLRRSAWNKGYATEGSRALISMGFTEPGRVRANQGRMGNAHDWRYSRLAPARWSLRRDCRSRGPGWAGCRGGG
jgi:RimJ/RimL family protein N-acetyltransferase